MTGRTLVTATLILLTLANCSPSSVGREQSWENTGLITDDLVSEKPTALFMFPVGAEGQRTYYSVTQGFNNSAAEGYCSDGSNTTQATCKGRWRYGHSGLDINGNGGGQTDCGDPVYAAADGVVAEAQNKGGWGKIVRIRHSTTEGDRYTLYGHLQTISVAKDQAVLMGQKIGEIGNGGVSTACHLHFGVLTIDEAAQGYYYGTPPATLLDPETFIRDRLVYRLNLNSSTNPYTCSSEPVKTSTGYGCNKKTEFGAWSSEPVYSLLQIDKVGVDLCVQAKLFKDGVEQKDLNAEACSTNWGKNGILERGYFWYRPPSYTLGPGSWRTEFRVKIKNPGTEYPKVATATAKFTVKPVNEEKKDMAAPQPQVPPPPPRPIEQSFYTFAGIKKTCDRPLIKASWWEEYSCVGQSAVIAHGQGIYGLVKLHYLAPNVRFRFRHEFYRDGVLAKTLDDATWQNSGWGGLGEVYTFPSITIATIGELPSPGTWTIRSFIVIDGKFTNWITDQQATIY